MSKRKWTIAGNRLKQKPHVKFLQYKSRKWEPFPNYDAGNIAHWYWEIKKVDGGSYWVPSSTTSTTWNTSGALHDENGKQLEDNDHALYYPQEIIVWIPDNAVEDSADVVNNDAGIADGVYFKAPNGPP
jgi:hypothetical protein